MMPPLPSQTTVIRIDPKTAKPSLMRDGKTLRLCRCRVQSWDAFARVWRSAGEATLYVPAPQAVVGKIVGPWRWTYEPKAPFGGCGWSMDGRFALGEKFKVVELL